MAIGASYFSDYVGYVYTFGTYVLAGAMEPADDGSGVEYCGVPYALMNCSETTGDAYFAGIACKIFGSIEITSVS